MGRLVLCDHGRLHFVFLVIDGEVVQVLVLHLRHEVVGDVQHKSVNLTEQVEPGRPLVDVVEQFKVLDPMCALRYSLACPVGVLVEDATRADAAGRFHAVPEGQRVRRLLHLVRDLLVCHRDVNLRRLEHDPQELGRVNVALQVVKPATVLSIR